MNKNNWAVNHLPSGIWEVIAYTHYENGAFTYKTVVRGISRDQAYAIVNAHHEIKE